MTITIGDILYTPNECAAIYLAQTQIVRSPLESVCIMRFIVRYFEGISVAKFDNSVNFTEHVDLLLSFSVGLKK